MESITLKSAPRAHSSCSLHILLRSTFGANPVLSFRDQSDDSSHCQCHRTEWPIASRTAKYDSKCGRQRFSLIAHLPARAGLTARVSPNPALHKWPSFAATHGRARRPLGGNSLRRAPSLWPRCGERHVRLDDILQFILRII